MLALDDAALARLCIAASAIPNRERSRWLQQLASQIDPTPNAIYSRRWAARQRAGRAIYHLELDTVAVECLLQREGLLPSQCEPTRIEVERALTLFINQLITLSSQDIAPQP